MDEDELEPLKLGDTKHVAKSVGFKGLAPEQVSIKMKRNRFYDPVYDNKRVQLPFPKKQMNLNVWSILKDAVGKDLSKFCVPGNLILTFSLFQ
jgi:hypothetical protein